jgi:alkylation response protein AidB-like acyl-CoA dehydrogenase
MRWELSDEQTMFQESLRRWLGRVAPSEAVRRWNEADGPGEYERALVDEGWLGVGTPESLAGQGGGLIELALAAEEFARVSAPSGAWLATVLAVPALAGNDEVLASVLQEGRFAALVVPADRPPDQSAVTLTLDGDRVSGEVRTVLGADRAGLLMAPVQTSDGVALVLIDAAGDGVKVTPRSLLDRSRGVGDVVLDGASCTPVDADAPAVLGQATLRAAVLVAADTLGAMASMLELSVDYSLQRHQFGVPIGSFQAVKHAAASMLVGVEAARSIVYFAAASVDGAHEDAMLHAATTKAQVTDEGARCADTALTVHGAIGYTWEYDLQLLYKRAKVDRFLFGTPGVWNERLAAALPLVPAL